MFDKTSVVKNKYFLFLVIIAFTGLSAVIESERTAGAPVPNDRTEIARIFDTHDSPQAILCETDVNFSSGTVKVPRYDHPKTYEKLPKYKAAVEENLIIEQSVKNYIFRVQSLTHYQSDLDKLTRLNI